MITLSSKIQKCNDWLTSEVDGEIVMMSIENGAYYALSPTGVSIWNKIAQPITVQEICNTLLNEYEIEEKECQEETLSFLNELAQENIIQVVDA